MAICRHYGYYFICVREILNVGVLFLNLLVKNFILIWCLWKWVTSQERLTSTRFQKALPSNSWWTCWKRASWFAAASWCSARWHWHPSSLTMWVMIWTVVRKKRRRRRLGLPRRRSSTEFFSFFFIILQHRKIKLLTLKLYSVDKNGAVQRNRKQCPSCPTGVYMAKHFDRHYCGTCHQTLRMDEATVTISSPYPPRSKQTLRPSRSCRLQRLLLLLLPLLKPEMTRREARRTERKPPRRSDETDTIII